VLYCDAQNPSVLSLSFPRPGVRYFCSTGSLSYGAPLSLRTSDKFCRGVDELLASAVMQSAKVTCSLADQPEYLRFSRDTHSSLRNVIFTSHNSMALSTQANYTDGVAAACQRS
jgi:hypothetical protein